MRLLVPLALLLVAACQKPNTETCIDIQPIGNVPKEKTELVKQTLTKAYGFKVVVLPATNPPQQAFVNIKAPRYRADKLIAWLKDNKPDTLDYIMGITAYDVSITKRDMLGRIKEPKSRYQDFGIFGLGYKPGVSCVVSYCRLGNDNTRLNTRLSKVCIHELGHNLGLDHCPNKKCVMTDAVEKISTIDNAEGRLCEDCKRRIE